MASVGVNPAYGNYLRTGKIAYDPKNTNATIARNAIGTGLSKAATTTTNPYDASKAASLLAYGGSGTFSAGADMTDQVARALAGSKRETTYNVLQDSLGGGGIMQSAQSVSPTLTSEDVIAAMLADRQAELAAAADQRGREEQARADYGTALDKTTGSMRETAEGLPGRTDKVVKEEQGAATATLAQIKQKAEAMTQQVAEREAAAKVEAEAMRQDALDEYQDTTANAIQNNRMAIKTSLQATIDQLTAQYSAQGYGTDSPQVASAIQKAKAQAAQSLGQVASDAAVTYSGSRASLRSTYDQLVSSVTQAGLSRRQQAEEQEIGAFTNVAQMERDLSNVAIQERMVAEQTRAQMLTVADQMELQGEETLASWLRDETAFTSPLATIIASAYNNQVSESDSVAGGISVSGVGQGMPTGGKRISNGYSANIAAPPINKTAGKAPTKAAPGTIPDVTQGIPTASNERFT